MLLSSLGGHDLNVLERTVSRSVVRVTAGNAHAVTHDHRRGGQLCQTLVHAVHGQLTWKIHTQKTEQNNLYDHKDQIKGLKVTYRYATEAGEVVA